MFLVQFLLPAAEMQPNAALVSSSSSSSPQCDLFIQEGARLGRTPAEVVSMCDITFSCVSDPKAARDVGGHVAQGSAASPLLHRPRKVFTVHHNHISDQGI